MGAPGDRVAKEVHFEDAEKDRIGLKAERQGTRGRVSLYHNDSFFTYVTRLVFATDNVMLYVNGHEATVQLKLEGLDELVGKIGEVCEVGCVFFAKEATFDAATALAELRKREAAEAADEMEDLPEELKAKALAAQNKEAKTKKVPRKNLEQLMGMGVGETRAIRAFSLCDGTTVENAVSWLEKHADDPNLDKPVADYLACVFTAPLGEEEKQAKAKELQAMLEQKRAEKAAAERERQRDLELLRRKNMQDEQELKEQVEKQQRLREYEARKREKEADAAAKKALRDQINAERIAKGWAPLEEKEEKAGPVAAGGDDAGGPKMTKEELFAQMDKEKARGGGGDWDLGRLIQQPEAPKAKPAGVRHDPSLPRAGQTLTDADLERAVDAVKDNAGCVKILKTYVGNLAGDPFNPKFRTINTTKAAFVNKVLAQDGGPKVLQLVGFKPKGDEALVMSSLHIPTAARVLELLEAASAA